MKAKIRLNEGFSEMKRKYRKITECKNAVTEVMH